MGNMLLFDRCGFESRESGMLYIDWQRTIAASFESDRKAILLILHC